MSKPLEIDLFRHARAVVNDDLSYVIGQSLPSPLSEVGREQSRLLGQYLLSHSLKPDMAYASRAVRAKTTARIALNELGLYDFPIMINSNLDEQNLGDHEGQPRSVVYTPGLVRRIESEKADYRHPMGESMTDVCLRMSRWLVSNSCEADRDGINRIHGYTHNIAIASLLAWIEGATSPSDMQNYVLGTIRSDLLPNASRTLIVVEGEGKFKIEHIGEPTN